MGRKEIFHVHGFGRGLLVLADHFPEGKSVLEFRVHATLVGMLKCRYFVAARKGKGCMSPRGYVDTTIIEIRLLLWLGLGSALESNRLLSLPNQKVV